MTEGDPLVVVRHGETEWSAAGRHTGTTDIPLTEAGREDAASLAPRLAAEDYALVLCSPLIRARETCELAGFGRVAQLCADLVEWDYGDYDGLTTPQIRERDPDWDLWRDGCPGGELPSEVGARADRVLERFATADGPGLAFAHGHSLRVLTARWLVMEPAAGARFRLAAAGIGRLGWERETRVIEQWNA
ncbi:MAG: histidine phosphatase family protein [Actinomycetota bacterium]|nr:histidine phosphatase family protein [Actinomycetota bacterium]